jgi:prepilin-type N-terminal cleavage/methylation domain-containing protein
MIRLRARDFSRRFARRDRAFTLIEIMVAMFLLTFLLSAVYSSWTAVNRAAKVGHDTAVQVQRTRVAIRAIIDSLLTVEMFGANFRFYAFEADTSGDYSNVSFVSRLPASFLDAGLFGEQTVRRVTFTVERGNEGNQLVMYQMPYLAVDSPEQKPFPIVLAKNVSLFSMEFWDAKETKWLMDWDNTNALPKLVRVSLGIGAGNKYSSQPQEVYTRVVSLPAIVIPREFQMSPPGPGTNQFRNPGGTVSR